MKLTERKLRGIIREELSRLNELHYAEGEGETVVATLAELADLFDGADIMGAKMSHGEATVALKKGYVYFGVNGAKRETGEAIDPRVDPYEALEMIGGGTVKNATINRNRNLRLDMQAGPTMVLMIPRNGTVEVENHLV